MQLTNDNITPPSIFLWGQFGQGKTAFVETGGASVQLADLDNGAKTGLNLKDKWLEERKKIDWLPFLDKPGEVNAWRDIKAHITSIPAKIAAKQYPYRVFVIDSFTTFCEQAFKFVLRNNNNLWGNPTQPQWGMMMIEVKQLMHVVRSLPICKIVIAHEQEETVGEMIQLKPKVPGKALYPEIPPLFDEILYAKKVNLAGDKSEFRIHTKSTSYYPARSRYNIDNFNMDLGLKELLKLMSYEI